MKKYTRSRRLNVLQFLPEISISKRKKGFILCRLKATPMSELNGVKAPFDWYGAFTPFSSDMGVAFNLHSITPFFLLLMLISGKNCSTFSLLLL